MRSQWFPHDYPLEKVFPSRSMVWKRGFECLYEIMYEGNPCLLYDGRAVYGFIAMMSVEEDVGGEELQQAIANFRLEPDEDRFVQLIIFDTMEERSAYLNEKYPQDILAKWTLQKYKEQHPD